MRKHIFAAILFSFAMTTGTIAQKTKPHKKAARQEVAKKKHSTKTETAANNQAEASATSNTLISSSSNQAYGSRRFSIADPTIKTLNGRANGSNVPVPSTGIVGMPKGMYGFANGKILLRNTTAPSSGTLYGSGAVGTGTTITGVGAAENAIGVNGKAPYAGPWLWGSRSPVQSAAPAASSSMGAMQKDNH